MAECFQHISERHKADGRGLVKQDRGNCLPSFTTNSFGCSAFVFNVDYYRETSILKQSKHTHKITAVLATVAV